MTSDDARFDAIWRKLLSGKLSVVAEGLAELRATGDGSFFDRLLAGAVFEDRRQSDKLPSAHPHVLVTVLACAPDSSVLAQKLRETVTSVHVGFRFEPGE